MKFAPLLVTVGSCLLYSPFLHANCKLTNQTFVAKRVNVVVDCLPLFQNPKDFTPVIQQAVKAASGGGTVFFPAGHYTVSDTIEVRQQVNIIGEGVGSQIYQDNPDLDLFHLVDVQRITFKDVYLGSAWKPQDPSNPPFHGPSLLKLTRTHRSRFENITMLGGHSGVYLRGSLLNTFIELRTGVDRSPKTSNVEFFAEKNLKVWPGNHMNQYWVRAEYYPDIDNEGKIKTDPSTDQACAYENRVPPPGEHKGQGLIGPNANTFIQPVLEGGTNGIWLCGIGATDATILGGGIEGVQKTGLRLQGTNLPVLVSGTYFEHNKSAAIVIDDSNNVRLESIFVHGRLVIEGADNTSIESSLINYIEIDDDSTRTTLMNVTYGFEKLPGSGFNCGVDQEPHPCLLLNPPAEQLHKKFLTR